MNLIHINGPASIFLDKTLLLGANDPAAYRVQTQISEESGRIMRGKLEVATPARALPSGLVLQQLRKSRSNTCRALTYTVVVHAENGQNYTFQVEVTGHHTGDANYEWRENWRCLLDKTKDRSQGAA